MRGAAIRKQRISKISFMAIKNETWLKRMGERSDLTAYLVHLTRGGGADGKSPPALDVLLKILREKKVNESKPGSGFIIGQQPAVCFQDTPLYHLSQNIHADQVFRKTNPRAKTRYVGVGLMFFKGHVFRCGGRPVIYERKATAKSILPEAEWWRIVTYDLSTSDELIDWTHEREWRVRGDFEFTLDQATVVLPNNDTYSRFVKLCAEDGNKGILDGIAGIVCLKPVFY